MGFVVKDFFLFLVNYFGKERFLMIVFCLFVAAPPQPLGPTHAVEQRTDGGAHLQDYDVLYPGHFLVPYVSEIFTCQY